MCPLNQGPEVPAWPCRQTENVTTFLDVSEGVTTNTTVTRNGEDSVPRVGPATFVVRRRAANNATLPPVLQQAYQQQQSASTVETGNFLVVKQSAYNVLAVKSPPHAQAAVCPRSRPEWGPW